MQNLRRDLLAGGKLKVAHTPGAPVYPIKVLQIGEGNFLRAFVDWMIDVANEKGPSTAALQSPSRCRGASPPCSANRRTSTPCSCAAASTAAK